MTRVLQCLTGEPFPKPASPALGNYDIALALGHFTDLQKGRHYIAHSRPTCTSICAICFMAKIARFAPGGDSLECVSQSHEVHLQLSDVILF